MEGHGPNPPLRSPVPVMEGVRGRWEGGRGGGWGQKATATGLFLTVRVRHGHRFLGEGADRWVSK